MSTTADTSTDLRNEIETANRGFGSTFGRGDSTGMAELYTREGQLLPTGSDVVSGHEGIAAFWQSVFDMGIKGARLDTVEVESCGGTAIEQGRYTLSGADGQTMDHGKYIVIWNRENGGWKLHRDIWNSSVAAEQ